MDMDIGCWSSNTCTQLDADSIHVDDKKKKISKKHLQ